MRLYKLRILLRRTANALRPALPFSLRTTTPVNLQKRDASKIRDDVAYAVQISRNYLLHLQANVPKLAGLRALELGPGHNFAPQLVLASAGIQMTIADRFLAPWDPEYHTSFYESFREIWEEPLPAIDRVLAEKGYPPEVLRMYAEPAEDLRSIESSSIDLVISNAVLEHVYSLPHTAKELSRVTVPEGINLHQIDFRDHRNFGRPLEYLLLEEDEFTDIFESQCGQCGNRLRMSEFEEEFRRNGFALSSVQVTLEADPEYLAEFIPRLRASNSRYSRSVDQDLVTISALMKFVKSTESISRTKPCVEVRSQTGNRSAL